MSEKLFCVKLDVRAEFIFLLYKTIIFIITPKSLIQK